MAVMLITGCRRETGFGQLTAVSYAKQGHTVYATMRDASQGNALVKLATKLDLDIQVLSHDVTSYQSNQDVVSKILDQHQYIDVLVNNAGIGAFGAIETMKEQTLRDVMECNFFAALNLTQAVLPNMRSNKAGKIIFVSSLAGRFGVPGEGAYCASKFATEGMAEVLSYEVKRFGIDVCIVEPGFFNTGMSALNTNAAAQYTANSAYDAFNSHMVASTLNGENKGENPQLVADTIVTIANSQQPKLRWQPGEIAPLATQFWRAASDKDWQQGLLDDLKLNWWLQGKSNASD